MISLAKHKKIFSFIIIFSVIGIIFVSSFSSIVKAQVDDGTGGNLYRSPAPTNQNTVPSTPSPGATTLPEYQAILDQVTGVTDETRTETNLQGTGVVNYRDTDMSLGASCAWWEFLSDPLPTIITCVFNPLIVGIADIFAKLIQWTLDINAQLFTDNPYIKNGWTATRDVANLGFVLIIVIIAFATILRVESYGVKKVLAKLIVVALLVNFSLMICAAFFSLSEVFTQYFLKNGFEGNPGGNIASAVGLTTDRNPSLAGSFAKEIAALIFGLILSIIALLTLVTIAIMLLIRYVVLGILIILSPLAWLCSILPKTENLWKKWWTEFIKWIVFAPLMLFFVWLAMFSPSASTSSDIGAVAGVGNLFIMTGLLLGGLIIANNLSITGANKALGLAAAAGVGIGAGAGLFAGRWAGYGAARATRGARERMGEQVARAGAQRPAFVRWLSQPIRRRGERMWFGAAQEAETPLRRPGTLLGSISERMNHYRRTKEGAKFIKGLMPQIKK